MMGLNKSISLLSRTLMLVLFIGYSGSIMMFYHTHMVNGGMITHSHPFKLPVKNGVVENHSHSSSQYILLQHFCETSLTDSIFEFEVVPDQIYIFYSLSVALNSDPYTLNDTSTESLRAPPLC